MRTEIDLASDRDRRLPPPRLTFVFCDHHDRDVPRCDVRVGKISDHVPSDGDNPRRSATTTTPTVDYRSLLGKLGDAPPCRRPAHKVTGACVACLIRRPGSVHLLAPSP